MERRIFSRATEFARFCGISTLSWNAVLARDTAYFDPV